MARAQSSVSFGDGMRQHDGINRRAPAAAAQPPAGHISQRQRVTIILLRFDKMYGGEFGSSESPCCFSISTEYVPGDVIL